MSLIRQLLSTYYLRTPVLVGTKNFPNLLNKTIYTY